MKDYPNAKDIYEELMHKERVIKVGLAEESFNHWTTYDDNGTVGIAIKTHSPP